jgi:hypothetical protein
LVCSAASGDLWCGPKDERGIPIATQTDGTPNGYHIITVSGASFTQRFVPANHNRNYQIRISSPQGVVKVDDLDSLQVIVNFFNGNELSRVICQIDEAPPAQMIYTPMIDPFIEKIKTENKEDYFSWDTPSIAPHIWSLKLPAYIKPGIHKLTISTKDEYSNEFHQYGIFEIIE